MAEANTSVINVKIAIGNKTISVQLLRESSESSPLTAEDVCISACKHLNIGTIARHVFALRDSKQVFLMPGHVFDGRFGTYELRIRFKIANIFNLKRLDAQAYNYYFHQIRNDVFDNKIIDLPFEKFRKEIVGLGVTDMYRAMLEENLTQETVENDYKKYIPKEVLKKHIFFLRKPIHDNLSRIRAPSHDANYVKDQYIKQMEMIAPDYPVEEFRGLIEKEGVGYNIIIRTSSISETEIGIKYRHESKNDKPWIIICAIKEMAFISIRQDNSVEISRANGVPFYIKFNSMAVTRSFVSLLDGYYRLSVKWTFNICRDVVTPSLKKLYLMKCHGPVGGEFSYAKLEEKCSNRHGCFIIRESETNYNVCYVDVCTREGKPKTYKIERLINEEFVFHDDLTKFKSLKELVAKYNDPNGSIYLAECVPPSEYDDSQLLLSKFVVLGDKIFSNSELDKLNINQPVCINLADLQAYSTEIKTHSSRNRDPKERVIMVFKGRWGYSKNKKVEVVMKVLKAEKKMECMDGFLDLAGQWAMLRSPSIVRLYGITLRGKLSMVMEYVKLGPLDQYLRKNRLQIKTVDLLEAASNLASALWHMAENGIVHGNIRCRKLLVSCHDENKFVIKLSDAGLCPPFTLAELHWIPIEFYKCFNNARRSIEADVWAFATTIWEIFSYGEETPKVNPYDTMTDYINGRRLKAPEDCPTDIYTLMQECWHADPQRRKHPQAIMRDISQMMYQVYNSRKKHSYARIDSTIDTISGNTELTNLAGDESFVSFGEGTNNSNSRSNWSLNSENKSGDLYNFNFGDFSMYSFSSAGNTSLTSLDSSNTVQGILEIGNDCNVIYQGRIGQGFYGDVFRGTLETPDNPEPIRVAIKRLKPNAHASNGLQDFEREIMIMKNLRHPNIVEILGIHTENEIALVMEYVPHGSLQTYLKINKDLISMRQLLKYALDIATGMDYLGRMNIVHRDLAARNILVMDEHHVKISDFGLARVLNDNSYYILKTDRELPITWYALESLVHGKFSTKSDVWSYGVTMTELFSYGEDPKLEVENEDKDAKQLPNQPKMVKALENGVRFPCPPNCPQSIYVQIIYPCWRSEPHDRPTFAELCTTIQDLLPHH